MKPPVIQENWTSVPLVALRDSPQNPRRELDSAALVELADSIREVGVLQPIVVRPVVTVNEVALYEIVCGHRRVAAARIAGLLEIPAIVRDVTNAAAQTLQLIENLQRQDLSPLEEAEGFRALIDRGQSVEEIAAGTHKSRGTVEGRLRLLKLPTAALKALRAGKLPVSVATLIGRIPSAELQAMATKRILVAVRHDGDVMSYAQAKAYIREHCMTDLGQAPFPVKDEQLLEGVGSCVACPHRTGNNQDLFGDIAAEKRGADVCTNPPCFARKRDAHNQRLVAQAQAEGRRVLEPKELKKLFYRDQTWLEHNGPYVDLEEQCPGDPKRRRLKSLLGKEAPESVLAIDPSGHPRQLVPRVEAEKLLAEKYAWAKPSRGRGPGLTPEEKRKRAETAIKHEIKQAAMAALVSAAEGQACRTPSTEIWTVLAQSAIRRAWYDNLKSICTRRGLWSSGPDKSKSKRAKPERPEEVLLQLLPGLTGAQTRALVFEVILSPHLLTETWGDEPLMKNEDILALFGVKLAAIRNQVRAQAKTQEKPTQAAKKRPRSKRAQASEGAAQ